MNWRSLVRLIVLALALLLVSSFVDEAPAQTKSEEQANTENFDYLEIRDAANVTASAFAVYNLEDNEEIISKNGDEVRSIASVTKLFAASVVLSDMDLPTEGIITEAQVATHGGAGLLKPGQIYTVRDLLFPLLLSSSNDAATVLEDLSQDELVDKMNELVVNYGAKETAFIDASGLDDGNVSTANELARLTAKIFESNPNLFAFSRQESVLGPYVGWENNSPVLNQEGYLGGKHGYTGAAGRTMVSIFDEEINGRNYKIAYILLDSHDLAQDIDQLRSELQSKSVVEV